MNRDESVPPVDGASLASPRRRRLRVVFLGMAILLCGAIIGSGLTLLIIERTAVDALSHPENAPERGIMWLMKDLRLSKEKRAEVEAVVRRHMYALFAIRQEVQPRVSNELSEMGRDVEAVLDDPQTRIWRKRCGLIKLAWAAVGSNPRNPDPSAPSEPGDR